MCIPEVTEAGHGDNMKLQVVQLALSISSKITSISLGFVFRSDH